MNVVLKFALACVLAVPAFAMGAMPADAQPRANPFLKAKSWAFQLKNLGPDQQAKIAASPYDLVVIDSSQFADSREIPLTRVEVERMKIKPDGSRRLVIAYFSVGEAESYRSYWKPEWTKSKPAWVGKENKQWKENFLVKYWEPVWQSIVYGSPGAFADRVIAAGFDGFYIDRADAYYFYGDTAERRQQMVDFIIKLTNYMRLKKPDIAILVQNAEELLEKPDYVAAIDGIAKEDLLYGITHREEPNKKDDVDWSGKLLRDAQAKGKAIFVIEYLTRANYIADAKARLDQLGFVMYTGPRGLASLNDPTAGPRRGPLDPTPENPSAKGTVAAKAKAAISAAAAASAAKAKAVADKVKSGAVAVKERAKGLVKGATPAAKSE